MIAFGKREIGNENETCIEYIVFVSHEQGMEQVEHRMVENLHHQSGYFSGLCKSGRGEVWIPLRENAEEESFTQLVVEHQ